MNPTRFSISRRAALGGLAGLSALTTGQLDLLRAAAVRFTGGSPSWLPPPPPGPLEPSLREFVLTASEFEWDLMPDTPVRAWGYNGQVPGPELRVRDGDRVRVTLRNALPVPTTIHWHGVILPPAMDGPVGLNQAPVLPGEEFVYEFTAKPAGSRWYHSHADPAVQVPLGLYGAFIVEPRVPERAYDRDYTYILGEWDLELTPAVAAGIASRGPGDRVLRGGELGADLFVMNGRTHGSIPPIFVLEGERVLIRLMHAGAEPHTFHTHGHSFRIVATDGNPVPEVAQITKDTLLIGPAERYDLELLADNPGVWMVHCHMEPHMANGMMTLLAYEGATPSGPAAAFYNHLAGGIGRETAHQPGMAMPERSALTTVETAPPSRPDESPTATAGPSVEVTMVDDRFEPTDVELPVGTTVIWFNKGSGWHSVASFDGSFESGRLEPGQSFGYRFEMAGIYQYLCKHHGMQGMVGRITVSA